MELTGEGRAAFLRLRDAAVAFDARLRTGLDDADTAVPAGLLDRLRENVTG
ncbi:hypothetical protein ACFFTK_07910 [Pseudonocardia petroleophila]|uniref:MarR family transcriptional regulator n=1 Tax=Pseudonocardia petroleophila TaxID=37331 RepID=A0A7G7MGD6_9PSEU|nr:hypothetical protein H6H00_27750 [Pseudonocardia petroleophila]